MGVEPEDGFVSDDELKSLLERWVAPGPSRVLDKRIETSFAKEFSGADRLSQSVLLPHRLEEVVSMKFCSVCEEKFADKFSFCPVDGTPLKPVSANGDEPSVTAIKDPSLTVNRDQAATIDTSAAHQDPATDGEPLYAAAAAVGIGCATPIIESRVTSAASSSSLSSSVPPGRRGITR